MDLEISIFRFGALTIAMSIVTQVIQAIALTSPGIGGWFAGIGALLLVGIGIATLLHFHLSQWLLDGLAIILGIAGGFWI